VWLLAHTSAASQQAGTIEVRLCQTLDMASKHDRPEESRKDAKSEKADSTNTYILKRHVELIDVILGVWSLVLFAVASAFFSYHYTDSAVALLIAAMVSLSLTVFVYVRHRFFQKRIMIVWPFVAVVCINLLCLFVGASSFYSDFKAVPQPLFTNGGLPATSTTQSNQFIVSLGGASIGPSGAMLDSIRKGQPTPIFVSKVEEGRQVGPFYLYMMDGRFYCDFDMYAGDADSPIVVKHNQLAKPLPAGWESNNNDVALEIVNQTKAPVFQMYYDGPNKIVINGLFVAGSFISFAGGLKDYPGLLMVPSDSPEVAAKLREFKLDRLFKYPRAVFPGVAN
jgi:hypothetical protein